MKYLRKEIEKLVENEDFVSYEEFIYELEEEKEEVKKYLEWRANGGKMNKVIARHKFWLHQTECNISTAYVEVLHEYQTVVMYMDDFEEIDSYTTCSKQEALKLHESLVEQWKDRLNKNRLVKADRDSLVIPA